MRTRDTDILIVPGLGGSGPGHWQSRWQAKLPTARRVEQADWNHPVRDAWTARLAEAVAESDRPLVIVAHSLGVILVAETLTQCDPGRVSGAFLVTPPSEAFVADMPEIDPAFRPYPREPLPCPAVLVGSTDDPYGSIGDTRVLAEDWNARLIEAGAAGHINVDSGHGPWPEGLMAFAGFLSKLATPG